MSKTDRTRPGWVTEYFTGVLTHDHRHGHCHVETLADARPSAPSPDTRRGGPSPDAHRGSPSPDAHRDSPSPDARRGGPSSGADRSDSSPDADRSGPSSDAHRGDPSPDVHRSESSPDAHCSAPSADAHRGGPFSGAHPSPAGPSVGAGRRRRPPCRHRLRGGYVFAAKVYGDRMTPGFEHTIYHTPMRRTARDVLHRARGEYNAGHRPGDDDLEDRWEPPLLPANNAVWLAW
ncbi:hypothetical protein [Actinoplanes sp. URMC 104]|uniref:hypothetical protein n=1 Tax=Actinoplanes sp. URMC 104 TaxID=3423409 RepID=UPI003F1C4ED1